MSPVRVNYKKHLNGNLWTILSLYIFMSLLPPNSLGSEVWWFLFSFSIKLWCGEFKQPAHSRGTRVLSASLQIMCDLPHLYSHSNKAALTHFLFLIPPKICFDFDYYPLHISGKRLGAVHCKRQKWRPRRQGPNRPWPWMFPPLLDIHLWFGFTCTCWELRFKPLGNILNVYGKSPSSSSFFKWEPKFPIKKSTGLNRT